jgi:hypothetical protein
VCGGEGEGGEAIGVVTLLRWGRESVQEGARGGHER